jgi:hypothetical protein
VEHVVFFPAPDGTPAFRRVSDFEEAVRFVEHLRNVENVTGASVYTLTEVPLAFRAWYRVEMPSAAPAVSEDGVPEAVTLADAAAALPSVFEEEHSVPFVEFASPESGSATGILVADEGFPASEPFDVVPIAAASLAPPSFEIDNSNLDSVDFAAAVVESAPVLEPAAGTRRDRGLGFFAR